MVGQPCGRPPPPQRQPQQGPRQMPPQGPPQWPPQGQQGYPQGQGKGYNQGPSISQQQIINFNKKKARQR